MRDDDRGTVPLQRLLDDFARIHARPVDCAAEHLLELDQPVPVVEIETAKYLVFQVPEAGDQILARCAGTCERGPRAQGLGELPVRDFDRGLQLRVARRPEAWRGAESQPIGCEQFAQRPEILEDLARKIDGRLTALPAAQPDGQKFRIAQRSCATREQFFARPLVAWPILDRHESEHGVPCPAVIAAFPAGARRFAQRCNASLAVSGAAEATRAAR